MHNHTGPCFMIKPWERRQAAQQGLLLDVLGCRAVWPAVWRNCALEPFTQGREDREFKCLVPFGFYVPIHWRLPHVELKPPPRFWLTHPTSPTVTQEARVHTLQLVCLLSDKVAGGETPARSCPNGIGHTCWRLWVGKANCGEGIRRGTSYEMSHFPPN